MKALTAALAVLVLAPSVAGASVISAARIHRYGQVVEIDLATASARPRWTLITDGQQLRLDFIHTRLKVPPRPLFGRETPPLVSLRAIDARSGRSRLILRVSGKTHYALGALPGKLVIRLAPAGADADLAGPLLRRGRQARAARHGPARALSAPARGTPQRLARWQPPIAAGNSRGLAPLVVIDPGHGGFDPGTEAGAPILEKNLALQIGLRLRNALSRGGLRVVMTRSDDRFLSLSQRTAIANADRADLFVSIHLNSSPDRGAAGIETYYLNNTTDRATIRLAHMENAVPGGYSAPNQPNLNYILADLRQQDKAIESASLAQMIEADTTAELRTNLGLSVNELGAKKGPFYVLVGARMPAVLVECGFLSNPVEARHLTEARYQQAIADGIAAAVINYLNADVAMGNL